MIRINEPHDAHSKGNFLVELAIHLFPESAPRLPQVYEFRLSVPLASIIVRENDDIRETNSIGISMGERTEL